MAIHCWKRFVTQYFSVSFVVQGLCSVLQPIPIDQTMLGFSRSVAFRRTHKRAKEKYWKMKKGRPKKWGKSIKPPVNITQEKKRHRRRIAAVWVKSKAKQGFHAAKMENRSFAVKILEVLKIRFDAKVSHMFCVSCASSCSSSSLNFKYSWSKKSFHFFFLHISN